MNTEMQGCHLLQNWSGLLFAGSWASTQMCGAQRGGPPLDCQSESPEKISQKLITSRSYTPHLLSHSSKSHCQEFTGHFCSKDASVVTSVFKKFSRVLKRLDLGMKSTLLQSVIQKLSKSKLRWKIFSWSPEMSGPRLTRRTKKVKHTSSARVSYMLFHGITALYRITSLLQCTTLQRRGIYP